MTGADILPPMFPAPVDEGRHPPGPEPAWEESWTFDFAADNATLGASVRLSLRPGEGRAWYWAHVVGQGRDLVAVRDHDVEPPRGAALELRTTGLWAELTCETPLEHWSAGLEALGVAFDDPAGAYGDERGQPTPVGLDLEWEAEGPCWTTPAGDGYGQPCMVHGEVLVGRERIEVAAHGARARSWGVRDWWGRPWWQVDGRLDDGTSFAAQGWDDAGIETQGRDELPGAGAVTVGDLRLEMTTAAHAPVLVPAPDGRSSRLWRGMCRFAGADGRRGTGWCERLRTP